MNTRNKMIISRVTEREYECIKQKAKEAKVTVSAYVRAKLLHSSNGEVRVIDTQPLRKTLWELNKQGTNLNQFMKFLNTYGIKVFDAKEAERVMDQESEAVWKVMEALSLLQEAAAREDILLAEDLEKANG